MMRLLTIASCLLLASSLTQAAQPITLELADHGQVRAYNPSTQFEVNPELGRAWVLVNFDLVPQWDEPPKHYQRIQVEGLHFDAERSAVVLSLPDRDVTCATVSERRVLGITSHLVRPTSECRIETVTQRESVDNGFFVSDRDVSRTLLHVRG